MVDCDHFGFVRFTLGWGLQAKKMTNGRAQTHKQHFSFFFTHKNENR
jgi:hypothetical protein